MQRLRRSVPAPIPNHRSKTYVDITPLANMMKDILHDYGLWRLILGTGWVVLCWRLPDIIRAIRWW